MAASFFGRSETVSSSLEGSLLQVYRKLILYPTSNDQEFIQHPQYSYYYSEFCRLNNLTYNKNCLKSIEEKQFDVIVRDNFMKDESLDLIDKISNTMRESIHKDDADVGKIIGALVIMELYVRNLIKMPWKKEFHIILTYSGMYKVWIEPHLLGTDQMFRQFGYQRMDDGDKYALVEKLPKPNLEATAMFFRLASVLCFIVYFAQKRLPEVSLGTVFEIAQRTPISEHGLVSNVKQQLLPKEKISKNDGSSNSSNKLPSYTQQIMSKPNAGVESIQTNKRDTGTQYDPSPIEETAVNSMHSKINLRHQTLDLEKIIVSINHKPTQDERSYKGARTKDLKQTFDEISTSTHYGFSQPLARNLSMCLSPDFDSIVNEEEEDDDDDDDNDKDETNQSPLSKQARERMKADEARCLTFSTFKKQSPMDIRNPKDIIPSVHHPSASFHHPSAFFHQKRCINDNDDNDDDDDDDDDDGGGYSRNDLIQDSISFNTSSTQSKSEVSLQNFIKARREAGVEQKRNK